MNHRRFRSDIEKTLVAIADPDIHTEAAVVAKLVASGVPRIFALKLHALVPLAYGRLLVSHMGATQFPDTVLLLSSAKIATRRSLTTDGVFLCAMELAIHMHHNGPRDLFRSAAVASSTVGVVNEFLNAGHELQELPGCTFNEPTLFSMSAEEWDACERAGLA